MDKKYYINKNLDGKINWVGIDEGSKFDVVKITNVDDKPFYDYQLHTINVKTNGEFLEALEKNDVIEVGNSLFESETVYKVKEVKTADEPVKKSVISKKLVAIGVAAGFLLATTTVLALNEKAQAQAQAWFDKKSNTQTESAEEADESLDLENKTVSELIEMLNDEEQEEAFHKIVNTQDYFNEQAAPTVKQGDKQLYLNFDETTAAYLYANAKVLSSDKLASFFGKSKIMVLNEETGEYEQMDKDIVSAKYLSFCLNLSYYYQLGATEKSGVDGLFENEKEAEFFRDFEAKILEYNRTKSPEKAAEIRKELENIFMSGNVDTLMDKYSGAASIIGTAIVPHLYLNGVIDKDMYNSLVEINETITCQSIYSQIEKIVNCKTKLNGKEEIIEKIAELQNLKTKDLDRNISLEEALEGYRYSDLDLNGAVLTSTPGFTKKKTVTKHYRKITKDRNEAIRKTSKKDVEEAEKEARKKAGIDEKNQNENDYWDGYTAGYNKAYDNVWGGGSGNVSVPSGSAKYVEGYKAGIAAGKQAAKEDLKKAEEAKKKHKPEKKEEVIEENYVEENNNNNSNSNSNTNTNTNTNTDTNTNTNTNTDTNTNTNTNSNSNNDNNNSNSSNTNTDTNTNTNNSSSSSSTPSSTPHEEIVEETFVYEDNSVSMIGDSLIKKIKSIVSHESRDIELIDLTLAEKNAKKRVRI